ncbi:hypothetical protein PP707_08605 [Acetobacter pasteurianus]|nr:hypothetical protein [Acetobacter pasteurianus]
MSGCKLKPQRLWNNNNNNKNRIITTTYHYHHFSLIKFSWFIVITTVAIFSQKNAWEHVWLLHQWYLEFSFSSFIWEIFNY